MSIAQRLADHGITLPTPARSVANYIPVTIAGGFAFVSGQLPLEDGKLIATGSLGAEIDTETGIRAARACFINILAQLDAHLIDGLASIARIIRLGGFIAAPPHFTDHAKIMNGASDLAVALFDEAGRHTRSTIGVTSLPLNAPVEVEATILLR